MLSPTLPPIITALGAEPTWHKDACLSFGAASFPGLHYLRNFLKTGEPWCSSGIPNSQPMASVELGTMQVSHSSLTELADWSFSICCCLGAESSDPCCPIPYPWGCRKASRPLTPAHSHFLWASSHRQGSLLTVGVCRRLQSGHGSGSLRQKASCCHMRLLGPSLLPRLIWILGLIGYRGDPGFICCDLMGRGGGKLLTRLKATPSQVDFAP